MEGADTAVSHSALTTSPRSPLFASRTLLGGLNLGTQLPVLSLRRFSEACGSERSAAIRASLRVKASKSPRSMSTAPEVLRGARPGYRSRTMPTTSASELSSSAPSSLRRRSRASSGSGGQRKAAAALSSAILASSSSILWSSCRDSRSWASASLTRRISRALRSAATSSVLQVFISSAILGTTKDCHRSSNLPLRVEAMMCTSEPGGL
mmetsp:Transcript_28380/g.67536  ORF Transcript_28380/g.67536 Transcript_28380/m.67536 type:complete len:209 (-) Transcript_28380:395-1021(-)